MTSIGADGSPTESEIEVRPPASDAELDGYWRLRVRGGDAEQIRSWERRYVETRPGAEPHERRAAFEGGPLVGCYEVGRRDLCAGPALSWLRRPSACAPAEGKPAAA
jgi:hypothetical protein